MSGAPACKASVLACLLLPFPPTVNHYWRRVVRGGKTAQTLVSEEGRAYKAAVACAVARHLGPGWEPLACPLEVEVRLTPPDRRRRDLDNYLKSLLDACTHARVWTDDSLIWRLDVAWMRHAPDYNRLDAQKGRLLVRERGRAAICIMEAQK